MSSRGYIGGVTKMLTWKVGEGCTGGYASPRNTVLGGKISPWHQHLEILLGQHSMRMPRNLVSVDFKCRSCWNISKYVSSVLFGSKAWQPEPLNRNESGRFGALKSDSTHHFFRNACTKSGSLRFSQFSGCW
jgi:hypothetical protein